MNTQEMQNIYKWAWIVLIILAVFLGIKTLDSLKNLSETSPSYNTISVSGEGEVFAVPDLATFSFTVSADAQTVAAAQEAVTGKVDAVLVALKELGIEEKDIKTSDYSVWPKYRYEVSPAIYPPIPSRQVPDGYTASHSVTVKVRDTAKAGEALAAAGSAGATNLSGLSFTIDDPEELRNEARKIAIENAREKAEILSDDLDVKLVRVVSYSDNSDGGVFPYYREAFGMGGADAPATPTLPAGENKIRVTVSVTYEIR